MQFKNCDLMKKIKAKSVDRNIQAVIRSKGVNEIIKSTQYEMAFAVMDMGLSYHSVLLLNNNINSSVWTGSGLTGALCWPLFYYFSQALHF